MKKIITPLLLLFVAASFVVLAVKEHRGSTKMNSAQSNIQKPQQKLKQQTVVYYFHGNRRCRTCLNIEKYTRKAITEAFQAQLTAKNIVIKSINLEQAEHEHFVKDYQLSTRSVVLSQVKNGKEISWKRLDKVWQLVRSEPQFLKYIQDELKTMIKKQS